MRILRLGILSAVLVTSAHADRAADENARPVVTILTPGNGSTFQWDAKIRYTIQVIDTEDGNTAYDEIPSREVLLRIAYVPDTLQKKDYERKKRFDNLAPLLSIARSTCLNCHAAEDKLIGPSFEKIAQRYATTIGANEVLAAKIIAGGSGAWGDLAMPPHPDLGADEAMQIAQWIRSLGAESDVQYGWGQEGTFRTRARPSDASARSAYVITANYTDHGMRGDTKLSKRGYQTIVLISPD